MIFRFWLVAKSKLHYYQATCTIFPMKVVAQLFLNCLVSCVAELLHPWVKSVLGCKSRGIYVAIGFDCRQSILFSVYWRNDSGGGRTTAQQQKIDWMIQMPSRMNRKTVAKAEKFMLFSTQYLQYILLYLNSSIWWNILIFSTTGYLQLYYLRPIGVQMLQIIYPQDSFVITIRIAISRYGKSWRSRSFIEPNYMVKNIPDLKRGQLQIIA